MILTVLIIILVVVFGLEFVGLCYVIYLEIIEKKIDIAKQEKELKRLEKLNDYEDL